MADNLKLRPAQKEILAYRGGQMAISAVPGSGKTTTLALLAAEIIGDGRVDVGAGQQVLIVTYLNASVDTFRAKIRERLRERDLPDAGYDVRTLHSLALEVVVTAEGSLGALTTAPLVLDEAQQAVYLGRAVDSYIEANGAVWYAFLSEDSPQMRARWRDVTERTAAAFMRAAKNERLQPEQIAAAVRSAPDLVAAGENEVANSAVSWELLAMMASIYGRYQAILTRLGALDFDDLIWQAAELLQARPGLSEALRQRWPFVLEDEAQDSVPLQEILLEALTGAAGSGANWVRAGDPNQAITSSFTSAHPRYFNNFNARPDVESKELPNSGRSAPLIFGAANTLVDWVVDHHPVPEVRLNAFRRLHIRPTPPGDGQPNPDDSEAHLRIKVYRHREDEELPSLAVSAQRYAQARPHHTLALLVPTNALGFKLAEHLDELQADYDNMLRGGTREREVAAAMHAMLSVLAEPLNTRAIASAYASLVELGHPAAYGSEDDVKRIQVLLRSILRPEALIFPRSDDEQRRALPAGVAGEEELEAVERLAELLRRVYRLRSLAVDDLALALGDELFAQQDVHEGDLTVAYHIANKLRQWRETQPDWRLPELVAQLADIASGRRSLGVSDVMTAGFTPAPGRITLATQHAAKGLEWDAVFLAGVDGLWIPGSLESPFLGVHEFLGGDPAAEVVAQLHFLIKGDSGLYTGHTATDSAHIEVICERLRLLYVGITRAKRFLHISRSRSRRHFRREQTTEPATVMAVLYTYLKAEADEMRTG